MQRPVFSHDCRGCTFLGHTDGCDVYHCDHIDLILRHGNSPEENKALPISTVLALYVPGSVQNKWDRAILLYAEYIGSSPALRAD